MEKKINVWKVTFFILLILNLILIVDIYKERTATYDFGTFKMNKAEFDNSMKEIMKRNPEQKQFQICKPEINKCVLISLK